MLKASRHCCKQVQPTLLTDHVLQNLELCAPEDQKTIVLDAALYWCSPTVQNIKVIDSAPGLIDFR